MQLTLGLCIILSSISFTFADDNAKPIIKTVNTPTSSSVFITYPEGFSGKVFTSCVNGICNSTSSPITEKEIKEIEDKLEEQRKAMQDFFRKQQEFFNQIFKYLDIFNPTQLNTKPPDFQNVIRTTV